MNPPALGGTQAIGNVYSHSTWPWKVGQAISAFIYSAPWGALLLFSAAGFRKRVRSDINSISDAVASCVSRYVKHGLGLLYFSCYLF